DAEVAGKEQVRLPCLDRNAGRDAAAVKVPRSRKDVVLGNDAPRSQRARLALNREDAIDQHEWLVGQAHPRWVRSKGGEVGTENPSDRTNREFQALLAVQTKDRRAKIEGCFAIASASGPQRLDQSHLKRQRIR